MSEINTFSALYENMQTIWESPNFMQKKSLILLLVGWALAPILMTSLSANLPGVGSMKNTISNARTAERRHVLPDGPDMWEVEGIGELVRIVPIVERIAIIKIHILKWSGRN